MKGCRAAWAAILVSVPAIAGIQHAGPAGAHDLGVAGLLSKGNRGEMPGLTLAAGQPLAAGPVTLKSGTYYELEITADGSQELALTGAEFFRSIWIDEVVINGLEVRPLGLDSIEFDAAGEMEIAFIAIKPGTYVLRVPGSTGETQRVTITIE